MKIFSSKDLKIIDQCTIDDQCISSVILIEKAALVFTKWLLKKTKGKQKKFIIFCGQGNNGADGLAIGALLEKKGFWVQYVILKLSNTISSEFSFYNQKLHSSAQTKLELNPHSCVEFIQKLDHDSIIIDAIFGSGLNRALDKAYLDIIDAINRHPAKKYSVDIPSGMSADLTITQSYIHADECLSFEFPKLSFLFEETSRDLKNWNIKSIGLSPTCIESTESNFHYTLKSDIQKLLKPRNAFSNKYNYGHALLIAGSQNMAGAAILTGKAALTGGCGLLTILSNKDSYQSINAALPESMTMNENELSDEILKAKKIKAIAIGPGMNNEKVLEKILSIPTEIPMIIDAFALNYLAKNIDKLAILRDTTIISPHAGEMDRLIGVQKNSIERLENSIEFAKKHGIIVILKSRYTQVIFPNGEVHFNSTGNPAMAKAGSGDVLCGIILSFLSQGYGLKESSLMACYIHGKAGDMARNSKHENSVLASDIIDAIPKAFKKINHK